MQYRLCLCILLHLIYHKDKTGVVYSKRCNIAYVFAYSCVWYITRTKQVLCIQNGAISPMYLHIPASDISQGQNWCCVFKTVKYRLCLCILLHLICLKDKTGGVYKKCAISPYVFAYCCIWYVSRTKLVLCIQNGAVSAYVFAYCCIWYVSRTKMVLCIKNVRYRPMSLHIAACDISQGQKTCCFQKGAMSPYVFAYCCIWYNYHEGRSGVVYSKKCNIAYVIAYCCIRHIRRTKLALCIQNGAVSS